MDGFAVKAGDTVGAIPSNPVILVCESQAAYVDTGDPLPFWADAVIPIEQIETVNQRNADDIRTAQQIGIRSAVVPWSHVRTMGEDIVATQLVLPSGHVLRPVDLGVIAASGAAEIKVSKKPMVAVIPTGTELVEIGADIQPGSIIEYNSLVLAAQIEQWGGTAVRFPICLDDKERIESGSS